MRNVLVVFALVFAAAAAFAIGQPGIATNSSPVSGSLLPVQSKLVPTTPLGGGPPGADEIQYDDGHPVNGFYFYNVRIRYAVRMDPAHYPAVVAQCDFCARPESALLDSFYVQIWFDRDGDGWPDFPAVWSAWARDSQGAPDSTAVTVRVPLGQVIIDSGSFWVGMMGDTVNGELQVVFIDSASDYPEHQVYYWPEQGTWRRLYPEISTDMMLRCWTMRQGVRKIVVSAIEAPSGEVWAGDTVVPRVLLANIGNGAESTWVRMRIEHTCSTDSYVDSCWVRLDPLQMLDTTYRGWTPLYPGVYRMQCTADSSDTSWTYFTVLPRTGLEQGHLPLSHTRNGIEVGPNPVRSAATIRYCVASESRVKLRVLDTRGRVVRTLVSGLSPLGTQTVVWDALDGQSRPVPRGIYFVRLESAGCRETRKVVLTR